MGRSPRENGRNRGMNPPTLRRRIAKPYGKLDVQSRVDAVARGLPTGSQTGTKGRWR